VALAEIPLRERGVCCPPRRRLPDDRAERLSAVLRTLGDPTRLGIVAILREADAPVCVCDLTETFGVSQPTVSHHIGKLREAGLVDSFKAGIWTFYQLPADLPKATRRLLDALFA
jgi:ArsR family transcriptional regulator